MENSLEVITPLMEKIVDYKVAGKTNEFIAADLGIPVVEVKKILNKKDTKKLLNDIIIQTSSGIVAKHINTISGIIDAKLQKIEESGDDLSSATKKDIVDLVQILNSISTNKEKLDTEKQESNTYVNILQNILK